MVKIVWPYKVKKALHNAGYGVVIPSESGVRALRRAETGRKMGGRQIGTATVSSSPWPADIFERGGKKTAEVDEETVRALYAKIGELAVANDFYHESSSPGAGNETRDDRAEPSHAVGGRAVPPAVDLAILV